MEYERIRKVQIGMLSPSKLRMKLLGPRDGTRKGESNSSKMSPVKDEDMKRARSRLLCSDVDEEEISRDIKGALASDIDLDNESFGGEVPGKKASSRSNDVNQSRSNEKIDINCFRSIPHQVQSNSSLSIIHPVRNSDEGGSNSHDSGNDAAYSFEFYRADRTTKQPSLGLFKRHIPSKWNDAEKWIMNRQMMNPSVKGKVVSQNHQTRTSNADSMVAEHKSSRTEFNQNSSQDIAEKFSFDPHGSNCKLVKSVNSATYSGNSGSLARPGDGVNCQRLSRRFVSEPTAVAATEFVSMRDIGTEMTPVPTPLGSVTPTRSSMSSMPSTPREGAAASMPNEDTKDREQDSEPKGSKGTLREREMRVKIRSEIAALSLQLGKKNIASWAREELEQRDTESCAADTDPTKRDYESCATAWEEAENTKHMARYKSEQVKIQAWENHQKAKIEAKMKKIEAKAEEMVVCATEKMAEKLAMTLQEVKEKQAAAEARMNKKAARISHMAERMRKNGQIPPRNYLCCSGFF